MLLRTLLELCVVDTMVTLTFRNEKTITGAPFILRETLSEDTLNTPVIMIGHDNDTIIVWLEV